MDNKKEKNQADKQRSLDKAVADMKELSRVLEEAAPMMEADYYRTHPTLRSQILDPY